MKQKKKRIFKIAVRCILAVLLCAVIYTAVFFAAVKIQNPNAVPMPFGFGTSLVLSGSMRPEITEDDLVFVTKPTELKVGDVVLYNTGESNVLHRIIKIDGDMITTQGDNNNTPDKPFSKSAVLGVYSGKITGFGKVVKFIINPQFVILIVFLLIMAAIIWLFAEEDKERKRLNKIRKELEDIKKENDELRKML
ncbi:MAG: signal peptidase I [Eubacteriales bacterium]